MKERVEPKGAVIQIGGVRLTLEPGSRIILEPIEESTPSGEVVLTRKEILSSLPPRGARAAILITQTFKDVLNASRPNNWSTWWESDPHPEVMEPFEKLRGAMLSALKMTKGEKEVRERIFDLAYSLTRKIIGSKMDDVEWDTHAGEIFRRLKAGCEEELLFKPKEVKPQTIFQSSRAHK